MLICLILGLYSSNNVSQRDYLRTEGDPGAAGYTIKEAIALARSVVSENLFCNFITCLFTVSRININIGCFLEHLFQVPGQRTLALSVIASILDRAIYNIAQNQLDSSSNFVDAESADWMAIWAYALGPEPELALSLRYCESFIVSYIALFSLYCISNISVYFLVRGPLLLA